MRDLVDRPVDTSPRAPTDVNARLLAGLLVTVLVMSWAMGVGRYGGPDEPAHVLRAAAVARGDVLGRPAAGLPSGYRVVTVPAALATGDPTCYRHDSTVTSQCATKPGTGHPDTTPRDETAQAATSAGRYPPLYYLLIGGPVRLIGGEGEVYWYRAVAALWNSIVVMCVVMRLRPIGRRAVVVVAAITPSAWFLIGVVNPNGFELVVAWLAWVGVARWVVDPSIRQAWWVAVPLALAVACRPVALLVSLTALTMIELLRRPTWRQRLILWSPVIAATGWLAAWNLAAGLDIDDPRTAGNGSIGDATRQAIGDVTHTVFELVASLGWLEFAAPAATVAAWLLGLGIAVVWLQATGLRATGLQATGLRATRFGTTGALERGATRMGAVASATVLAAAVVIVPVIFEVVFHRTLGPIWQGRYSLPTATGIVPLLLIARAETGPRGRATTPAMALLASGMVIVSVAVEITTFWWVLRRYSVGTDGPWSLSPAAFSASGWLAPRTWLMVNVITTTVAGACLIRWISQDLGRICPGIRDKYGPDLEFEVGVTGSSRRCR